MNLAIDVGNTRTKFGVFESGRLIEKQILPTPTLDDVQEIANTWQISNAILSNTGKVTFDFDALVVKGEKRYFDNETPIPVRNTYRTPKTLGKDRLAGVIAAWTLFPRHVSCVIDAGTCITIDVVDHEGTYLGGNISPGWQMRFRAMDEFTHALPLVSGEIEQSELFGRSTEEALNNGGTFGVIFEIEGYLHRLTDKFGQINIILTGGDAVFFDQHIKSEIFVHPELILQGLDGILRYQNNEYE